MLGDKFPNITNSDKETDFNCKFTPEYTHAAAKIMPATFVNSTAIMCATPGGWDQGDKMKLQVTFNGADYDQNAFEFTFFNIAKAFPRSGPSNGKGGPILISGQGFKSSQSETEERRLSQADSDRKWPLCKLNGTIYEPISVNWTQIQCPMPAA